MEADPPGGQHGVFEIDDDEEGFLLQPEQHASRPAGWKALLQGLSLQHWLRPRPAGFQRLPTSATEYSLADDTKASEQQQQRWCPEETATALAHLTFSYVTPLINKGFAEALDQKDLPALVRRNEAAAIAGRFHTYMKATVDAVKAHYGVLWRALYGCTASNLWAMQGLMLVRSCATFTGPALMALLLRYLETGGSIWVGLGLALAMALASTVEALAVNSAYHCLFTARLHFRVAMMDALYRKSLRVASYAKLSMGVGSIVNLQSNDVEKLCSMLMSIDAIWNTPFQVLVIMLMLSRLLHWFPALMGLAVALLLAPAAALLSRRVGAVRKQLLHCTDERVRLCAEVFTGMKAIKLYAWEAPYQQRVEAVRERELKQIWRYSVLNMAVNMIMISGPILISLAGFAAYAAMGFQLRASVAFPALALFNMMRTPITALPGLITSLINGGVAYRRLNAYLEAQEMAQMPAAPAVPLSEAAVAISGSSFFWQPGATPVLQQLDLRIAAGQLVVVVGPVGSGKSSLLAALLGEMHTQAGKVRVAGRVAYTAQDPWIQNKSLRGNILLHEAFDAARYSTVLQACALLPDLQTLPAGDETEIGEKGVNLSGGQRHRIALARACYAAADVLLLDDPLSAVDAHVGRHLLDKCICGLLAGKTRILVTHQLDSLAIADLVVVMKDGRIVATSTYADLMAQGINLHVSGTQPLGKHRSLPEQPGNRKGQVMQLQELPQEEVDDDIALSIPAHYADAVVLEEESVEARLSAAGQDLEPSIPAQVEISVQAGINAAVSGASASTDRADPVAKGKGQLVGLEGRATGRVARKVYMGYLAAWGVAFLLPLAMLLCGGVERTLQVLQNWWLSVWSDATDAADTVHTALHTHLYLGVYFGLGLASIAFQLARYACLVCGALRAARRLHSDLLAKVLRLPMAFFDTQPVGRLLNRFSKDTEAVDILVLDSIGYFIGCLVNTVGAVAVVVAVTPMVAVLAVPLSLAYGRLQRRYIATSRDLKRLDSVNFSPIFSHLAETLQGLATVRAFRGQQEFLGVQRALLDASTRAWWPIMTCNRWLQIRLEAIGIAIMAAISLAVALLRWPADPGLAGLALTSVLNLTLTMNWMVRMSAELEMNMNSCERMLEYSALPPEAGPILPGCRPEAGWPQQGAIAVRDLVVRYRPDLDPVLRSISFSIKGREKVGVVGRTGCGKSTLMMALYRIIEPCGGAIAIDGVDTATIGLFDLRSRLALVPQDPIVFSGSIRSNLDPFGRAENDAAIWRALYQAGLAATIKKLRGGLDASVSEGGANLSTGQRQLLCMARALLQDSAILVLDEGTSNVDGATDALIQGTLRSACTGRTVLTIAHRLETIIDCDRILVLEAGRVREFDTPANLLQDAGGAFSALVKETSMSAKHRHDSS